MFCPKCGNDVKNGAQFCPKCGEKMRVNTGSTKKAENKGCRASGSGSCACFCRSFIKAQCGKD